MGAGGLELVRRNWTILSQHAEEASMLWLLRNAAVEEPHYDLPDLLELDNRVEAHLDGLRIAGDAGWSLCEEQLGAEEAGEVFAAGAMAFLSGEPGRLEKVLEVVAKDSRLMPPLVSALEWQEVEAAIRLASAHLASENPLLREAGLRALTALRRDPGSALTDLLGDDAPGVQAAALQAAGVFHRVDHLRETVEAMGSSDPEIRFPAAWATALLGDDARALALLREGAENGGPHSRAAAMMVVRRQSHEQVLGWLNSLEKDPQQERLFLWVAGQLGDPVVVPRLFSRMMIPELARPAGEAFTFITGVDLAYADFEGDGPEDFIAGPTEDPADEDVALDPDEDLPWPEAKLLEQWWSEEKGRFSEGSRYLLGKAISPSTCEEVLRSGWQRHRTAAALELASSQDGSLLFNTAAPAFRQAKALAVKPSREVAQWA